MAVVLSASALDAFLDKSIDKICPLGFGKVGDVHNHCAHFVSHVLKLNSAQHIGYTCAGMVNLGKKNAAAGGCIRVNEIYNACDKLSTPDEAGCLAYFTLPGNMEKDGSMGSMADKHIGIYLGGMIWNYGNTKDQVRKSDVAFLGTLYGKSTIARYSKFPAGATTLTLEQIQALAK
ncbi:MAG: hypothetical protein ACJ8C4_21605 [Gemmataceae bacterium]